MSGPASLSFVQSSSHAAQGPPRGARAVESGRPRAAAFGAIGGGITAAMAHSSAGDAFHLLGYDAAAAISGIAPLRLVALLRDIHAGFWQRRTSADIARAHGLSSGMLRAFRAGTGRTLHEYITAVRVIHGVRALALTDEKVSTVADNVGYRSKKDFYQALHRHCGLLPKAVRALPTAQRLQLAANIEQRLLRPRRS